MGLGMGLGLPDTGIVELQDAISRAERDGKSTDVIRLKAELNSREQDGES